MTAALDESAATFPSGNIRGKLSFPVVLKFSQRANAPRGLNRDINFRVGAPRVVVLSRPRGIGARYKVCTVSVSQEELSFRDRRNHVDVALIVRAINPRDRNLS